MVDRSQKVHQLGFKCVRIFTHLLEWKFTIPFKLFHSLEADRRFTNGRQVPECSPVGFQMC